MTYSLWTVSKFKWLLFLGILCISVMGTACLNEDNSQTKNETKQECLPNNPNDTETNNLETNQKSNKTAIDPLGENSKNPALDWIEQNWKFIICGLVILALVSICICCCYSKKSSNHQATIEQINDLRTSMISKALAQTMHLPNLQNGGSNFLQLTKMSNPYQSAFSKGNNRLSNASKEPKSTFSRASQDTRASKRKRTSRASRRSKALRKSKARLRSKESRMRTISAPSEASMAISSLVSNAPSNSPLSSLVLTSSKDSLGSVRSLRHKVSKSMDQMRKKIAKEKKRGFMKRLRKKIKKKIRKIPRE